MYLQLRDLLPSYFDESKKRTSELWGKAAHFWKEQFIKIVAPSGSGKTSLMHFLYGMRSEYNGSIVYNSANLRNYTPEDFAGYRKDHVSIVFQDLRLFPEQSVQENLELKRQLNPFHPAE